MPIKDYLAGIAEFHCGKSFLKLVPRKPGGEYRSYVKLDWSITVILYQVSYIWAYWRRTLRRMRRRRV